MLIDALLFVLVALVGIQCKHVSFPGNQHLDYFEPDDCCCNGISLSCNSMAEHLVRTIQACESN